MLPSSVISSIISYISSSVTETSSRLPAILRVSLPIPDRIAVMGRNTFMSTTRSPAQARLDFSLNFLPILFGSISPIRNMARVMIKVDAVTADSPHLLVTAAVTTDAAAIWAIFVHIRRVVIASSKLSRTYITFWALPFPLSALTLIFVLETLDTAVSVRAQYADAINNKQTMIIVRLSGSIIWIFHLGFTI